MVEDPGIRVFLTKHHIVSGLVDFWPASPMEIGEDIANAILTIRKHIAGNPFVHA
jgi:hypothetical protein